MNQSRKEKLLNYFNLAAGLLLTLLFLYAALSKLLILGKFQEQLAESPLIPVSIIRPVSMGLPILELTIPVLLNIERLRKLGLYLSFFLMSFFSLYLIVLTTTSAHVPCACGGILGKMSYSVHILFNIFFTILTFIGLLTVKAGSSRNRYLYG